MASSLGLGGFGQVIVQLHPSKEALKGYFKRTPRHSQVAWESQGPRGG